MAKFENIYDDNNAVCPYCGEKFQPESEDYSENQSVEECSNCGTRYKLHQIFSVTHVTTPDCELNGDKHQFETKTLTDGRKASFCKVCNKCGGLIA